MGKFDKYVKAVEEQVEFEQQQKVLHNKHDKIDDDTIIIEKSNTFKFTLTFLKNLIKTVASISFILLATIGIITLIYSSIRIELFDVLLQILNEVKQMI